VAGRGALASLWRTVVLILIGCGVGLAVFGIEASDLRRALSEDARLRDSGLNVLLVEKANGTVSANACESINGITGVVAAGGLRFVTTEVVNGTLVDVRHYQATPRFALVLGSGDDRSAVFVGGALTQRLAVADGGWIDISGTRLNVGSVIQDRASRTQQFGRAVVVIQGGLERLDSCWVELHPTAWDVAPSFIRSRFVDDSVGLVVRPLIPRDPSQLTPLEQYHRDAARWLWAVGALLIVGLLGLFIRARRSILGLWAVLGLRRSQRSLVVAAELVAPILGGVAIAYGTVLVAAGGNLMSRAEISRLTYVWLVMIIVVAAGYVGVVALVDRGDRMVLLKDHP